MVYLILSVVFLVIVKMVKSFIWKIAVLLYGAVLIFSVFTRNGELFRFLIAPFVIVFMIIYFFGGTPKSILNKESSSSNDEESSEINSAFKSGFIDGNGIHRNYGDKFTDWQGCVRDSTSGTFVDGAGYTRNAGDAFIDGDGRWHYPD